MAHYSIVDFCTQDSFMSYNLSIKSLHSKATKPFLSFFPLSRPPFTISCPKFQLHFLQFLLQKLTSILLTFLDHHSSLKGDLKEKETWWFRACFLVVLHPTLGRKVTLQNPHFSFQLMVSSVSFN